MPRVGRFRSCVATASMPRVMRLIVLRSIRDPCCGIQFGQPLFEPLQRLALDGAEDFLRTYTKRDALAGSIRPFRAASTMSPCKWRIRSIIEMRSRATWDAVG
jgi:hypothetical protein